MPPAPVHPSCLQAAKVEQQAQEQEEQEAGEMGRQQLGQLAAAAAAATNSSQQQAARPRVPSAPPGLRSQSGTGHARAAKVGSGVAAPC